MKFSKKILETFVELPNDWIDLMEDVGLEVKSTDGDIMNLELLANRGDHYCYTGLAREIYGRTGNKVTPRDYLPLGDTEIKYGSDLFDLDTEKCLAYSLTGFSLKQPGENRQTKNDYILNMLPASGVNIILDIIDVTNVVMLEYGQPAHVYDADKIVGKIHVRDSRPGEKAALLFHDGMTEIPSGTCVIADDEKILCIAGVIGCHAAEVDENSKNILFETALFDPVSIRKASRSVGHQSIASQIFERGGNYGALRIGAERARKLYRDIGWEMSGAFNNWHNMERINVTAIDLSGDYVREQLEINIKDTEIEERLERYGFIKENNKYLVPTWRVWDVKGERADLIEELCRSVGYNTIPSKLPPVEIGAEPTCAEIRKSEIDSYLVNNGFYEVFTDNLYSPRHVKSSPISTHTGLQNSVDGGYAFLKNNTVVQATELVAKNLNVKNKNIRAYEWGKVFQQDGEHEILWGVMNGEDALRMKGLIQNMTECEIVPADLSGQRLHPRRSAIIKINGENAGIFGEIHPELLAEWDIKNDTPVYFEIPAEMIKNAKKAGKKYESPSAVIPSIRDISIAVPYGKPAGEVLSLIKSNYPQIAKIEITDVYDKPKEQIRNITFTLTFAGEHSAEALNTLILDIIKANEL